MKTSPLISEISNSEDTAGTITKQAHNLPSKSAIRQKQGSALQAQSRSLISAAKASFKKQMAEFAKQASLIENEKLRADILNLIRSIVRSVPGYRNWDDLSKFVESSTDTLRIGIASGLYGLRDPRTQKLFHSAEARAMDRAMMANQRDN